MLTINGVSYEKGDAVRITDGPLQNVVGQVSGFEIDGTSVEFLIVVGGMEHNVDSNLVKKFEKDVYKLYVVFKKSLLGEKVFVGLTTSKGEGYPWSENNCGDDYIYEEVNRVDHCEVQLQYRF